MRILAKFQGKSGLQNEKRPRTCFRVSLIRFRTTAAKTSTRLRENLTCGSRGYPHYLMLMFNTRAPTRRPAVD